jgi:hypothetical protein
MICVPFPSADAFRECMRRELGVTHGSA